MMHSCEVRRTQTWAGTSIHRHTGADTNENEKLSTRTTNGFEERARMVMRKMMMMTMMAMMMLCFVQSACHTPPAHSFIVGVDVDVRGCPRHLGIAGIKPHCPAY